MIRMFVYVALLLAAALGLALLLETPGTVLITYGGFEYKMTLAKAVAALIVLLFVTMALWALVRTVLRLPSLISLSSRMRRRSKGYTAVSRGLIAVGTGDTRAAARHANDAERLLGKEPLALLLKAQAAQLGGDRRAAEHMFTRMLDSPETRVLGLRGLFVEARRDNNPAARRYAEEAHRLEPASTWAGDAMIDYLTGDRNWRGALAAVDENARRKVIDKDTAKRQKATLLTAAALEENERNPDNAFISASEALKLVPGMVPAAVLAARRLTARGDYSKATRLLETAWKQEPHPDLADAYLAVRHGDSTTDRLKRARALLKMTPTAREAKLAIARAALDARDFHSAREVLEQAVLEAPTARVCRLMAELEERESGNVGMVRKWLARASHAPRDPAWVADGHVSEHWAPVSPVTGRIDSFRWITPPQSLESSVRAAIEADRMAPPVMAEAASVPALPPVAEAAAPDTGGESSPPEAGPAAPEPVAEPAVAAAEAVAVAEPVVAAPVTAAEAAVAASDGSADREPALTTVLTHRPDDPGPRLPDDKAKKRWSLFG